MSLSLKMRISFVAFYILGTIWGVGGNNDQAGYKSGYQDDQIYTLPGLDQQPGFKQYSGYLKTSSPARLLHYWFVESSRDPVSDPLIVWLNGGPGCSSLDGLFSENGPFSLNQAGDHLEYREYSWNKFSNVVYLESPAGVGFSQVLFGNMTTTDDQIAHDHYKAIKNFLEKFPHFRQHAFFMMGESYAGDYISILLQRLVTDSEINLKASAIASGYMHHTFMDNCKIPYWYYHGFIDTGLWNALQEACCDAGNGSSCQYIPWRSEQCCDMVIKAFFEVGLTSISASNIYIKCDGSNAQLYRHKVATAIELTIRRHQLPFNDSLLQSLVRQLALDTCTARTGLESYMNRADVTKALNIPQNLPKFEYCSTKLQYSPTYFDMSGFILNFLKRKEYRLLLYNGDLDTISSFLAEQEFVNNLNLKETKLNRPWYYEGHNGHRQIGGFVREFDNLHFLTVKGAGHMVPGDQPRSTYTMIQKFINNQQY